MIFCSSSDLHWRAHARNHVFALRVHQKFAVELFRARRWIAREAHTRAAGVAQVAVYHRLHVDRRAQHVVDVVDAAIVLGAIVLPRAEHRIPRHHQLLVRVLRKVALGELLDDLLVLFNHFLQRLGIKIGVELGLLLLLLRVEDFIKRRLRNLQHDVAEHLNQPPVRVGGEPWIVAALGQRLHTLVVQSEIENRVHHPGHGKLRARAHAHQQRVLARRASALQRSSLASASSICGPLPSTPCVIAHVFATGFGLDGEAGRHRQAGVRHLGQPSAFAAENVFHLAIAIGLATAEEVHILWWSLVLLHWVSLR
jgi:hypothetical protein